MGILVAMRYPTKLFANQADHTYVKCSTDGKAWGCWGGKTGGTALREAAGSTKRANCIAKPDERANIKCYLINGVCHQAANRVLLPAGITVRGARGYSISEAIFGTYGRVGYWPCKSPFDQCPGVTGDLPQCRAARARSAKHAVPTLTDTEKLDWQYLKAVLALYKDARSQIRSRALAKNEAENFHVALFMHMAEYHLGPMFDKKLASKIEIVRRRHEKKQLKAESGYAQDGMSANEFVDEINSLTISFQDAMANAMTASEYESLFRLAPGDTIVLADPAITKKVMGADTLKFLTKKRTKKRKPGSSR